MHSRAAGEEAEPEHDATLIALLIAEGQKWVRVCVWKRSPALRAQVHGFEGSQAR